MTWQQPSSGPGGETILREMAHPCINGCGGTWKHPAAESGHVIDAPTEHVVKQDGLPARVRGLADEANEIGTDFIIDFVHKRGFDTWGRTPEG